MSKRLTQRTIEMIKDVSIVRVANQLGLGPCPERDAKYVQIRCPFHNEKDASFTLYKNSNKYLCFGCNEAGDSIELVKKVNHCDYIEALKFVADCGGVVLEYEEVDAETQKKYDHEDLLERCWQDIIDWCHVRLMKTEKALAYAVRRWGMEVVEDFRLGYAPENGFELRTFLKGKGYDDALLCETGCFKESGGTVRPHFQDRIMIPLMDERNHPKGMAGRDMSGKENVGKYINSIGFDKSSNLFAYYKAKHRAEGDSTLYMVEGQPDCMTMHKRGFVNCVAFGGASINDKVLAQLAPGGVHKYTYIYLFLDGDVAGVNATMAIGERLVREGYTVYVIGPSTTFEIGDGKQDPDSILQRDDWEAEWEKIRKGQMSFFKFYLINRIRGKYVKKDNEWKAVNAVDTEVPEQVSALVSDVVKMMKHTPASARYIHVGELQKVIGNEAIWSAELERLKN